MTVSSSLAQIKLVGDFQGGGQNWFTGAASADLASVTEIKRILGLSNPSALPDARIALTAKATAGWRMLTLSELRLDVLKQDFEGALAVTRASGRLLFSGTLATSELKLEPWVANAPPIFDAAGNWSGAPFDPRPLAAFDLDLRVSASRVVWRGLR